MKILILALIILVSCSTLEEDTNVQTESPPFFKRYKKKDKELLYIAVKEKGNADSATMNLIDETVKKFDPEIIITKYTVQDPDILAQEFNQCEQKMGCTPASWTCFKAIPRGIPCVSGEPYDSQILRKIVNPKILADEILFFYTYRSLVKKSKSQTKPLDLLPEIIEAEKKVLNLASRFDKEEFLLMYKDKMGQATVRLSLNDLRPDRKGHYLQRISSLVRKAHDDLILEKIEELQYFHGRVMVVYGVEHYKKQLIPLEDFFSSHLP